MLQRFVYKSTFKLQLNLYISYKVFINYDFLIKYGANIVTEKRKENGKIRKPKKQSNNYFTYYIYFLLVCVSTDFGVCCITIAAEQNQAQQGWCLTATPIITKTTKDENSR